MSQIYKIKLNIFHVNSDVNLIVENITQNKNGIMIKAIAIVKKQ